MGNLRGMRGVTIPLALGFGLVLGCGGSNDTSPAADTYPEALTRIKRAALATLTYAPDQLSIAAFDGEKVNCNAQERN